MIASMRLRRGLAFALLLALAAPVRSLASPASSAQMLVAQGRERESAGDALTAMKRYADAIAIDPTCEDGYLSLGALREKRNELTEADDVYSVGMARIPTSVALVVARGHVRRLLGKFSSAAIDLKNAIASTGDLSLQRAALVELVALNRSQGEPAAELGAWRRLLALARKIGDEKLQKEATIQTRALGLYLGEVDPAIAGRADSDAIRRALAAIARRQ